MKIIRVLFALLFLCSGYNCSETKGTKGTTNPLLDDPYIIDIVMCIEVLNDKPAGITTIFIEDDEIHLWVEWDNIFDQHNVAIEWINPDGNLEFTDDTDFNSENGRQITWFSITPGKPAKKGVWEVAVYLDGNFERSLFFELV